MAYKLVPVELNDEMISAVYGCDIIAKLESDETETFEQGLSEAYRAMLAAHQPQ